MTTITTKFVMSTAGDEHKETDCRVGIKGWRGLVDNILARYPGDFAVFRELLQNADDAKASSIEIHFLSKPSEQRPLEEQSTASDLLDLITTPVQTWVFKNDGKSFEDEDWSRLITIAYGNPHEDKIGAFGVGFYSVFSVTDEPTVVSGDSTMSIFYVEDELWSRRARNPFSSDQETAIEMPLRQPTPCPNLFDLTRFLILSLTFMVNVRAATIYFDNRVISTTKKVCGKTEEIHIPPHFVTSTPHKNMDINRVDVTEQEIQVEMMEQIYFVGSNNPCEYPAFTQDDSSDSNNSIFGEPISENTGVSTPLPSSLANDRISCHTKYSIYSAHVEITPCDEMRVRLLKETRKNVPKSLRYDMVHFSKEDYDRLDEEDKRNSNARNIFRGPQGLSFTPHRDYDARIFIGQSTLQTTGIGGHMASRFIPTVERGAIDLSNGEVAKWNEELLYVGGFLARLVYETELNAVCSAWKTDRNISQPTGPENPHFLNGMYIMNCFTFRPSTPDAKVSSFLKSSFFTCSTGNRFPIVSNAGVHLTKDVRLPFADFARFMKDTPLLPPDLFIEGKPLPKISMQRDLPKSLRVQPLVFGDVLKQLESKVFQAEEMAACITWLIMKFRENLESDHERFIKARNKFMATARTLHPNGSEELHLSTIKFFVHADGLGSFISPIVPLPPGTLPSFFTKGIRPELITLAFGWKEMSAVDWLQHLAKNEFPHAYNIRTNPQWTTHVLASLTLAHIDSSPFPFSELPLSSSKSVWATLSSDARTEIRDILGDVPFIPTNQGIRIPKDAYFPTCDVFHDLPRIQLPYFEEEYEEMLKELGVQKFLDLSHLLERAGEMTSWTNYDMFGYLLTIKALDKDQIKNSSIFFSTGYQRHKISDLYESQPIFHALQLPILKWPDQALEPAEEQLLFELGLQKFPPLDTIIQLASASNESVRATAFEYFLEKRFEYYHEYESTRFNQIAFIPALTAEGQACMGTPEEVLLNAGWTLLGFYKVDPQKLPEKAVRKLGIQEHPSSSSIISRLERAPPQDKGTVCAWFSFLAANAKLSCDDLQKLSSMHIVPVEDTESQDPQSIFVSPEQCFISEAEKSFYSHLFTFVDFGSETNDFLRKCGAKSSPSPTDITRALVLNPQRFLDCSGDKEYQAELNQIALQRHCIPEDLRGQMKRSPMFLAYRRPPRADLSLDNSFPPQLQEFHLKLANETVIVDDIESRRLFDELIFVVPQDNLLEEFYACMGAKMLSSLVHEKVRPVKPRTNSAKARDTRDLIVNRMRLFLHDNNSRIKQNHPFSELGADFVVNTCHQLNVIKTLNLGADRISRKTVNVSAAITQSHEGDHIELWLVKNDEPDWHCVAAALCRVVLEKPKAHDTLLLMTMLETDIITLEKRGYSVGTVEGAFNHATIGVQEEKTKANVSVKSEKSRRYPHPANIISQLKSRMHNIWKSKRRTRNTRNNWKPIPIDAQVEAAMKMCIGKASCSDVRHNREQLEWQKKKRNVDYCHQQLVTSIKECSCSPIEGIKIFQTEKSPSSIPRESLDHFARIIARLAKEVFLINLESLQIFWKPSDTNLMGFNRDHACIYLNLAHYEANHFGSSNSKAYIAWYFIITHEVAHNINDYHDESHELLSVAISQAYLMNLHNLLNTLEL
ncbi:hypothetical protein BJ138DRAFT_1150150 [Hygrophoropsis aurantiaca]|uniref:Uncharacterized protein n=1 Tax=Hygrophoropsis aurantiaca TaxID=72124 RepID=A0ACB8AFU7_9AGAM|nr:hypothetical protein BJ138DRAFT_1150150 [Hygrophoropsis aurantiaca]